MSIEKYIMDVNRYVGIKYLNRGRDFQGCDCWGITRLIYKGELSINLPNIDGYTDSEDGEQTDQYVKAEAFENWEKIKIPMPFCVVVFKMGHHCSHVGVMLDSVHFVHSLKGRQSCVERVDKAQWQKRVSGYYEWSPS